MNQLELKHSTVAQRPTDVKGWGSRQRGFGAPGSVSVILQHLVKPMCLLNVTPNPLCDKTFKTVEYTNNYCWYVPQVRPSSLIQLVESSRLRPPPLSIMKSTEQKGRKEQL